MLTIKVLVEDLVEGDIIIEELFIENTNISLFPEGTIVNQEVKEKLVRADIRDILISRKKSRNEDVQEIIENSNIVRKTEFKDEYRLKVSSYEDIFESALNGDGIDAIEISNISEELFKNSDDIYMAIESISELKGFDDYTYIHSVNVALYAMLLGKWLELEDREIKELVTAGILHDIGKSKIDINTLNKEEELTQEELIEIKNHAQYGYDICKDMTEISDEVKEAVLSHHEREDGSGYPNGLKADEISLYSKIIAICDVYDAMTSDKVYREKQSPFQTFDEMINYGYGKLDTKIMLTFLDNIGDLYVGLKVKLNTGEVGEIVFISPQAPSKPLVKVGEKFIDFLDHKDYRIEEIF